MEEDQDGSSSSSSSSSSDSDSEEDQSAKKKEEEKRKRDEESSRGSEQGQKRIKKDEGPERKKRVGEGWESLAERLKKKRATGETGAASSRGMDLDEVMWAIKEMGGSEESAKKTIKNIEDGSRTVKGLVRVYVGEEWKYEPGEESGTNCW